MINDINTVKQYLDHLIRREFLKIPVVYEPNVSLGNFTRDRYIRHWCRSDDEVSKYARGSHRIYNWEIIFYFKRGGDNFEQLYTEITAQVEKLERLLHDNSHYTINDVNVWYDMNVNIEYPVDVTETDDVDIEGFENIVPIQLLLEIYRACDESES